MKRNDNGTTTGSASCRTIIGQTAIDAEKDATIARLTAELTEARADVETAFIRGVAHGQFAMPKGTFTVLDSPELATLRAERDALIGAAYEAAASECASYAAGLVPDNGQYWMATTLPEQIRAITPDAATAALDRIKAEARAEGFKVGMMKASTFQSRVHDWIIACFGAEIGADRIERNHRFIEEALELVQANGCTASEAHQLVDYVYGRPVGEPHQEVGGVMNTLAALCTAGGLDMAQAGEDELERVWTKVEQIRAKQAAKPKHSPLPIAAEKGAGNE